MSLFAPPYEPREQKPVHDIRITLYGVEYRYKLVWRERVGSWFYWFGTTEEWIISGERLVIDFPLMSRYKDERLPNATFYCADTANTGAECGYEDLGRRCKLIWFTATELAPAASESPSYTVEVL